MNTQEKARRELAAKDPRDVAELEDLLEQLHPLLQLWKILDPILGLQQIVPFLSTFYEINWVVYFR